MSTPSGTHTYAYDATDRLTGAAHPTGPVETFSYNPVGNRQTDATASYSYDAANRLLSRGGVSYTWDGNGNLTSKKVPLKGKKTATTTYRYDGDNRLVQVIRGGSTIASFTYDPFGRRVSKATSTGMVYYIYDGKDILAEVDAAGTLLTYYVHGPGIDEPLAMVKGTQVYFYHADALGTITHLTNSTGAMVQTFEYDSFGNIMSQSGTITQPYTFTGREWDAETGFYYYRARYYDSSVGRFLSSDPILMPRGGLAGAFSPQTLTKAPSALHPYVYVHNNPLRFLDPTGQQAVSIPISPLCYYNVYLAWTQSAGKDDKYRHCLVGCNIARYCGGMWSIHAGLIKELLDLHLKTGTFEVEDIAATWKGTRCAFTFSTCDNCCKCSYKP